MMSQEYHLQNKKYYYVTRVLSAEQEVVQCHKSIICRTASSVMSQEYYLQNRK